MKLMKSTTNVLLKSLLSISMVYGPTSWITHALRLWPNIKISASKPTKKSWNFSTESNWTIKHWLQLNQKQAPSWPNSLEFMRMPSNVHMMKWYTRNRDSAERHVVQAHLHEMLFGACIKSHKKHDGSNHRYKTQWVFT